MGMKYLNKDLNKHTNKEINKNLIIADNVSFCLFNNASGYSIQQCI